MDIIYLDNASTTRVRGEAAAAAMRAMTECYGNPSSIHTLGREAKNLLENARKNIASALGAERDEVFFTSGGTESDNLAILSGADVMKRRGNHIISSLAEHDAVLRSLDLLERRGFEVTRLKPDADGSVSPSSVMGALRDETVLITLMMVNNETGAVTDIEKISELISRSGSSALIHTDAVQSFLKIPFSAKLLGADLITVSAHKIHGPKGVGALYVKKGLRLKPLIVGGGQENMLRSGTEGLPQIAAFGEAASAGSDTFSEDRSRMLRLRSRAAAQIVRDNPEAMIIGGGAPHILSLSLPGHRSEPVMNFLESRGIFVSKSSACKKGGRSHVLEAIGLGGELIDGAIRVGLSRYTTMEEMDALCAGLRDAGEKLLPSLR